jgi:hypothetical protein
MESGAHDDVQVDEPGFANIGCYELGGDLDGGQQQSQVAGCGSPQSQLIAENMAESMDGVSIVASPMDAE